MKRGIVGGPLVLFLVCVLLVACMRPATPSPFPTTTPPATSTTAPSPTPTAESDPYLEERMTMVRRQIEGRGVSDEAVLGAMRAVRRHLFVPEEWVGEAYGDHPLPIGYGQTISQPYVVAWMTELLRLGPDDRVLEIGTGSGYQAAVLGNLVAHVYTVEIIEELASQATQRLADMAYGNITVSQHDGYYGWKEHAPYDAIIVTCAPDHIPPPLIQQLRDGGRMVVPVGPPGGYQSLFLIVKEEGEVKSRNLGGVRFVPLTR